MKERKKAQDWPNLNKYQQANTILEAPEVGQKRVVFMGDSITEFWSKVNRISQACSFEFQEDAEAYMDSYRPELMLSLALERALNECRNVKK